MSPDDPELVREMSALAFRQDYRLELMLYIADGDGIVNLTEAATALGLTPSKLQRAFSSLRDLELITPLPSSDDDRKNHFLRSESHAWLFAVELKDRALESSAASRTRRLGRRT